MRSYVVLLASLLVPLLAHKPFKAHNTICRVGQEEVIVQDSVLEFCNNNSAVDWVSSHKANHKLRQEDAAGGLIPLCGEFLVRHDIDKLPIKYSLIISTEQDTVARPVIAWSCICCLCIQ